MRRATAPLAAALCLAAAGAFAHDFWIEPSSFHPAPDTPVAVRLLVGQDFRGDPEPRDPRRILRFGLVSAAGETPVAGLPGADPAGFARLAVPGTYWIVYRSRRSPHSTDAGTFEKYLADEGLDRVLAIRKKRAESEKPGREVFSRSVKSLLVAGGGGASGFDRALGLTLELVPDEDPTKISPGGQFPVRLLYEGKPLEGALVVAINRAEPEKKASARTDREGRVMPRLWRKGAWLVKSVHMVPAPPGVAADWESVWTSLTFEIP